MLRFCLVFALFCMRVNGQRNPFNFPNARTITLRPNLLTRISLGPSNSERTTGGRVNLVAPPDHLPLLTCSLSGKRVECRGGRLTIIHGDLRDNSCTGEDGTRTVSLVVVRRGPRTNTPNCSARAIPMDSLEDSSSEETQSPAGDVDQEDELLQGRASTRQTTCECGWTNKRERIVGGEQAEANEFPLMAGLKIRGTNQRTCGGSIITRRHILTAAHCLDDIQVNRLQAVVGDHDIRVQSRSSQTIDVARAVPHPGWDRRRLVNDIAVLVLARDINFNRNVGPVCIPTERMSLVNEYVTAMGWGLTQTPRERDRGVLRKVDLRVINLRTCSARYGGALNTDRATQICTYERRKDTCQGDSGGPLVWTDPETQRLTQVALVSFGRECGSASPAVNTDVAVYTHWIESTVQRTSPGMNVCKKA